MKTLQDFIKTRLAVGVFGTLWVLMVISGMWAMMVYQGTPGTAAEPSVQWPTESRIPRDTHRATLVMTAHPHCPCTRASIGELNTIMARAKGKLTVYVLFFKPMGKPAGWEKTDLWKSAAAIPDVHVLRDDGGTEARRFDATTSGQTTLFDSEGRLLFSGGITVARGHLGDNAGRDAVVSLATTGKAQHHKTFVFGCSLRNG